MKKGLIIVFTGNGKGKTSAALGTALRAAGQGQKVCIIQFIKNKKIVSGEHKALKKYLPQIELHTMGSGLITPKNRNNPVHKKHAQAAWLLARRKILSGEFNVVILDEFTHVMTLQLIPEREVLDFLQKKPRAVHIVITGRAAPSSLIDTADLVTEYIQIKHPFEHGDKASKGIDY